MDGTLYERKWHALLFGTGLCSCLCRLATSVDFRGGRRAKDCCSGQWHAHTPARPEYPPQRRRSDVLVLQDGRQWAVPTGANPSDHQSFRAGGSGLQAGEESTVALKVQHLLRSALDITQVCNRRYSCIRTIVVVYSLCVISRPSGMEPRKRIPLNTRATGARTMDTHVYGGKALSNQPRVQLRMRDLPYTGRQNLVPHECPAGPPIIG